ncbi:hypothetical protein [Streptomyces kronopolitis]
MQQSKKRAAMHPDPNPEMPLCAIQIDGVIKIREDYRASIRDLPRDAH